MEKLWEKKKEVTLTAPDGSPVPITVRTLGTPDNPLVGDEIKKRHEAGLNRLALKAQREVAGIYGGTAEAIAALCVIGPTRKPEWGEPSLAEAARMYVVMHDPDYVAVKSRHVRDLIVNGVVGGEGTYALLWKKGETDLLLAASAAVEEFNRPSPKR